MGVPAEGLAELPEQLRARVEAAPVVVGGPRHLAMLPDPERGVPWPKPLRNGLKPLFSRLGDDVVVLATGDPLLSGVATTLIEELGAQRIRVHPGLSSETLARARMLWSAETTSWISLVGRDPHRVLALAAPGERLLVLSADEHTPAEVARILTAEGWGASRLTVLGDLGTPEESRNEFEAAELARTGTTLPRLNVVAVEFSHPVQPLVPGPLLPDAAFTNDGQLTRQPMRLVALAALAPAPGQVLWDVGLGSGSIAISWCRAADRARAVGFDKRGDRAARARGNATRLGVGDRLDVRVGDAASLLQDPSLPRPDAVFFGGGCSRDAVTSALSALRPGGRLVIHSVTLETEALLAELHARHGGELLRLHMEQLRPLGSFRGWQPSRHITSYCVTKEQS
ncbi:precorrin-6y C5,15-methyltransferase (decarboxylating) subunit CbiE [Arachnia propionica]|uniref:Precorrin-6y C5,15-methyltransferase (Decarboxylating) subunit CbiE n=1 Tax=Arachnia propionica TaxID=1750 RepID=A0A3P1T2Z8_9ACTN|nr:precorrin-6y C5,15-methyltransferase (decarboxylating) subunit CbiE [Arachnia propionica]